MGKIATRKLSEELGTPRMTLDASGAVAQAGDYYPYDRTLDQRSYTTGTEADRYRFTGHEHDAESGYDYHGARYFQPEVGRYLGVDVMANTRSPMSPYIYVQANPVNRVDLNGKLDSPIYDVDGNLIGTDDEGLQGTAIIMDKSDFKQGMKHADAIQKSIGFKGLKDDYAEGRFYTTQGNLPSRPDYDGKLTLHEANLWTSLAKVLHFLLMLQELILRPFTQEIWSPEKAGMSILNHLVIIMWQQDWSMELCD